MIEIIVTAAMLGFLHALEPDHVVAIANLGANESTIKRLLRLGASWGLGHALALAGVAFTAYALGAAIPDSYTGFLEAIIGIILIALGVNLILRLWKGELHAHRHRHPDGKDHIHFHAHALGDKNAPQSVHQGFPHDHDHGFRLSPRAFLIGITHGLAGSASLVALALAAFHNLALAFGYIVMFSTGSILGMILFSGLVAVPFTFARRKLGHWYRLVTIMLAFVSVAIGSNMLWRFAL